MKKGLVLVLFLLGLLRVLAGETAVIYVKTGDPDIDPDSATDLSKMVSTLNALNASNGHTYKLYQVETFSAASELIRSGLPSNTNAYVGVAHGVFESGEYRHTVKEVGGAQPEDDVSPIFMRFAHCSQNHKIDADQIGSIAASVNPGDKYQATSTSGNYGGNGVTMNGYYQFYSVDVYIFYLQDNGHLAAYLSTEMIGVWIPEDGSGGDHDAA